MAPSPGVTWAHLTCPVKKNLALGLCGPSSALAAATWRERSGPWRGEPAAGGGLVSSPVPRDVLPCGLHEGGLCGAFPSEPFSASFGLTLAPLLRRPSTPPSLTSHRPFLPFPRQGRSHLDPDRSGSSLSGVPTSVWDHVCPCHSSVSGVPGAAQHRVPPSVGAWGTHRARTLELGSRRIRMSPRLGPLILFVVSRVPLGIFTPFSALTSSSSGRPARSSLLLPAEIIADLHSLGLLCLSPHLSCGPCGGGSSDRGLAPPRARPLTQETFSDQTVLPKTSKAPAAATGLAVCLRACDSLCVSGSFGGSPSLSLGC